jgi:hypothetical protein
VPLRLNGRRNGSRPQSGRSRPHSRKAFPPAKGPIPSAVNGRDAIHAASADPRRLPRSSRHRPASRAPTVGSETAASSRPEREAMWKRARRRPPQREQRCTRCGEVPIAESRPGRSRARRPRRRASFRQWNRRRSVNTRACLHRTPPLCERHLTPARARLRCRRRRGRPGGSGWRRRCRDEGRESGQTSPHRESWRSRTP